MSAISIFAGAYCQAEKVASRVADELGYELVDDRTLLDEAGAVYGMDRAVLVRTLEGRASAFDRYTRERERCISFLRACAARRVARGNAVLLGLTAQLVPSGLADALKVCLLSRQDERVRRAKQAEDMREGEARQVVKRSDEAAFAWSETVSDENPWDPDLYDLVIRIDQQDAEQAIEQLVESIRDRRKFSADMARAATDFVAGAEAEAALAAAGHTVEAVCEDGVLRLRTERHVPAPDMVLEDMRAAIAGVDGIRETRLECPDEAESVQAYHKIDFETPGKVLLVDDEQAFARELSDRLHARGIGAAVVYDGAQALNFFREDAPEIVVLDMDISDMDGEEVLRLIREQHPDVQVIVLSAHGADHGKRDCEELGCFEHLEKPVDVEALCDAMRRANRQFVKQRTGQA
ncbi:MAG: response regulator [Desulfatibacillaceae bacterium]